MKKLICIFLVLTFVFTLSACSQMPFNGDIVFHSICLTIPERFIRDSTQSSEDLWVFEHNQYSEYILISRKDITGDTASSLAGYVEYMKENGAQSEIVPFLNGDAVVSTYYLEETLFCQEILLPYDHSFYAVALRGGDESGFKEITDTIAMLAVYGEVAS